MIAKDFIFPGKIRKIFCTREGRCDAQLGYLGRQGRGAVNLPNRVQGHIPL